MLNDGVILLNEPGPWKVRGAIAWSSDLTLHSATLDSPDQCFGGTGGSWRTLEVSVPAMRPFTPWLASCCLGLTVTLLPRLRAALGRFGGLTRARVRKRDIAIVARRVAYVLVGMEFVYIVGANALLRSNGVVAAVQTADGVKLDYASAYSIVPGHVHVKRLRLRFEGYNVQFQVFLERATLDLNLTELLRRRFHAHSLLADGVSFRMRHKSHGVGSNGLRFAAYPKIEGFSDPPLYHGVKPPSTPDAEYNAWQIRIENVVAHVAELWVLEYRYAGDGDARGSFLVQPERLVQVDPAALRLRGGSLSVGDALVARRVTGNISYSMPNLDVKNTVGLEVFRSISTKLELELTGGDARFLNVYTKPTQQLELSGETSYSINARVMRGVVEPKSEFKASSPALRLAWPNVSLMAETALQVRRTRLEPELDVGVVLQDVRMSSQHSKLDGPAARQLKASVTLIGGDLTQPIKPAGADLKTEASLANLAWFDGLFAGKARPRFGGAAKLSVKLTRNAQRVGDGHVDLSIQRGHVKNADFDIHSDLHAVARFRTEQEPAQFAQGAVSFRASDGDTLLSLAVGPLAQRLLSAGLNLGALDGTVAFHAAESGLKLELTSARCGAVSGRGYLRQPAGGTRRAAALLSAGPIHVGLRVDGAQTETAPMVDSSWLEETWPRLRGLPPQG